MLDNAKQTWYLQLRFLRFLKKLFVACEVFVNAESIKAMSKRCYFIHMQYACLIWFSSLSLNKSFTHCCNFFLPSHHQVTINEP